MSVITAVIQNRVKEPIKPQSKDVANTKRGKTCARESRLDLFYF